MEKEKLGISLMLEGGKKAKSPPLVALVRRRMMAQGRGRDRSKPTRESSATAVVTGSGLELVDEGALDRIFASRIKVVEYVVLVDQCCVSNLSRPCRCA